MDLLEGLKTLKVENEIQEEEEAWLFLKDRSRGLMIEACAHAAFFCKLFSILSQSLQENKSSGSSPVSSEKVNVGIIGGGHLGKQLARVLLQLVPVPTDSLRISTRRPEVLGEFQELGIQCFYQNTHLVTWANVVFLCCLPAQLPSICVEIQRQLTKTCVVYSLVTAIPVPRLKLLLNHTSILRPHYQCVKKSDNIWGANMEITAALQDPAILRATCPYSPAGGIMLDIKWLEGVLYAALNFCTARDVPHPRVLKVLSEQLLSVHSEGCSEDRTSCPKFQLTDFVNKTYADNLPLRRPFPWFDLTAVQLKETPFSQHLSKSPSLQDHLTNFYCHSLSISLTGKDQPVLSVDFPFQ
ncbi:PREDICTED: NADP-dependent oxidoreductase domain-containing protein 1 [Elephantulus edwardii]|uniref:NADP-dependent oxidoreductase domain-containing protein 1 n=1 Tax=Elephantulus edwardii TaxID=28737 RepID=UPI0003F0A4B2|nr:PREDICTED: NADP-dependent oxidoreductase domain-containing protein 1 [Elephantulus edwardii]